MTLDLTTALLAGLAVFVGVFLQRVSGTGVGLVVGPTLALLIGPALGVFATNIVTITSGGLLTILRWRDIDWYRVRWIVLSAIPGAMLGAWLVRELPTAWLQIVIGGTVVLALAVTYMRARPRHSEGRAQLVAAGAVGGLFNTSSGVAAPAMVIYSRFAHWQQPGFGATMQPVFCSLGILSVLFKSLFGSIGDGGELPAWWYLLIVVGVVLVGAAVGSLAAKRMRASTAQSIAIVLAGLGGLAALVRGIWMLVAG